ncbi:MAG: nucleoside transporter [Acidobacteria bacterium]|nr:nucleoside transporter [Acidobacteriota bacterium]
MPTPSAAAHLDALYEFDREPVTDDRLVGPGYFAGSLAGEHVAATEFVIGVMFVNWGASVRDMFLGLAIGNALAVLTWTLLCAPVAVQTRLTLYWYLRSIGGPWLTVIYNVLNAVLFCILAGCMITVSASAVRIPFGVAPQVHWYPTDVRFVLVVCLVGAVVVGLAMAGFKKLAAFSSVLSPWMFLMFIAGALVGLPVLAQQAGLPGVSSIADLFTLADRVVWTGRTPDGSAPMGFLKIAAFAWICNLAMHGGLSDMALFRYARHSSYGLLTAVGMFLGHYLAWMCAGLMGAGAALLLRAPLTGLDSGAVAYATIGWAGILAVIAAGWTTANPTLYRAGLALQAVTPDWSRARVTLVAGIATTVIACFPFVFTRLLDFVGLYGLLLAPAGAIVLAEHWLFPRLGLTQYWATYQGRLLNWPALVAWVGSIAIGFVLERSGVLHLFYLFVPVYLLTMVMYMALASMAGARTPAPAGASGIPGIERRGMPPASPAIARGGALRMVAGIVAVTALVACLVLPARLLGLEPQDVVAALPALHAGLIVATLVYLVAGTVFAVGRYE